MPGDGPSIEDKKKEIAVSVGILAVAIALYAEETRNKLSPRKQEALQLLEKAVQFSYMAEPSRYFVGHCKLLLLDIQKSHHRIKATEALWLRKFKNSILNIYTEDLQLNLKGVMAHARARGSDSTVNRRNSDVLLEQFEDRLQDFVAQSPQLKRMANLFKRRVRKKFDGVIKTNPNYWDWGSTDNVVRFIHLISQKELAKYIKDQAAVLGVVKSRRNSEEKSNELQTSAEYLNKQGFSINNDAHERSPVMSLVKIIKEIFAGSRGEQLRGGLQKITTDYKIYSGLLDVLQDPKRETHPQQLEELAAKFRGTWEAFFHDRPALKDVREQISQQSYPADSSVLWAFRGVLEKESHPVFDNLYARVNALYVSQRDWKLHPPKVTQQRAKHAVFHGDQPKSLGQGGSVKEHEYKHKHTQNKRHSKKS